MATTKTMTAETMHTHVLSMIRAFNAHDIDKLMSHFTADVVWDDPSLPSPAHGRAEAAKVVEGQQRAFPDLHFPLEDIHFFAAADGRSAAATWRWIATMTGPIDPPGYAPTGKEATCSGVCVYEFRGGLIAKHTIVYDQLGLLQRLGLMPSSDSLPVKVMVGVQKLTKGVTKTVLRH